MERALPISSICAMVRRVLDRHVMDKHVNGASAFTGMEAGPGVLWTPKKVISSFPLFAGSRQSLSPPLPFSAPSVTSIVAMGRSA
ncbi:hypothetical protein O3S81_20140 [Agrobacterium sp. SOY23]|uniref:hypothetical protein n=1 Tax=Agrobacterium sp. SOY23 TaxID=3014555 RepID=UPI0022AEDC10|nr:hypothetical protein [Agrobacterium sp. SOY23]MCZ4432026.1 hypothetical protein [Agrobacterium sp. SOY23]